MILLDKIALFKVSKNLCRHVMFVKACITYCNRIVFIKPQTAGHDRRGAANVCRDLFQSTQITTEFL